MATQIYSSFSTFTADLFRKFPQRLRVAYPLGLGKPNQLANLIYQHYKKAPESRLEIFSALSLSLPKPKSDVEARFLNPFLRRHFGDNYPELDYVKDIVAQKVPENISVYEFYYQAGVYSHKPEAQKNYVSLNYTFAAQHIFEKNIDAILQLVSKNPETGKYSLSCNPDMTLDVADKYRAAGKPLMVVGVVHPDLPYMEGDAEVDADFFSAVIETPELAQPLFALPKNYVDDVDHMIGWHASQLVADDGTLQIGIGSLSDALVHSMILRHQKNSLYVELLNRWWQARGIKPDFILSDVFEKGLYGTSEMVMDGFMHLRRSGILKRTVQDFSKDIQRFLHGAFFLGSKEFYQWLRDLSPTERKGIGMTRVLKINDLYDENEMALRRQRKNARFFNTGMSATLLGEMISDTLEDGQVVSGVGGQYNFVAMSHELAHSRSVLMIRATRGEGEHLKSNILWNASRVTIPRHLRDIIITEYGIADLRFKTDEQVIQAMIEIADARFQHELRETAVKAGKLDEKYQIPAWAQKNTLENIKAFTQSAQAAAFAPFPFGSDFTKVEEALVFALLELKKQGTFGGRLSMILKGLRTPQDDFSEEMKRMGFDQPQGIKSWIYKHAVLGALAVSRGK